MRKTTSNKSRLSQTLILLLIAFNTQIEPATSSAPQEKSAPAATDQRAPRFFYAFPPAPLFFRETWKQSAKFPFQEPVSQEYVTNPNLELKLYGGARLGASKDEGLLATQSDEKDPPHIWSGTCLTTCALTLRDRNNLADLTERAKIRWVTRIAGFHQLRPILKLADGTWLVGDHADGYSADYRETEFSIATIRWRRLDITRVVEARDGEWVDTPDLSRVDEIGFTDLMPGSGHGWGGWFSIGTFEVYGKSKKR